MHVLLLQVQNEKVNAAVTEKGPAKWEYGGRPPGWRGKGVMPRP